MSPVTGDWENLNWFARSVTGLRSNRFTAYSTGFIINILEYWQILTPLSQKIVRIINYSRKIRIN